MKILCSTSYNPTLNISSGRFGTDDIVAAPRACDWGNAGPAKHLFYLRESLKIMKRARRYDAVVLCTAGAEAFFIGGLGRFICPHTLIVCADFLMPRKSRAVHAARGWLRGVDAFLCIRRGDIPVLRRRFGVSPEKCHFTYFPANLAPEDYPTSEGDYVYSGGWAHRDWPTLVEAMSLLPFRAVLSIGVPVSIPEDVRDRVTVLPMQTPDGGRKLMAAAALVVLSLADTELPSGPLVLLDAMAAGKAVVATNVNGTRDYVEDGKTGLLVTPADPPAMAAAIDSLMTDGDARRSIGAAARRDAVARFSTDRFMKDVLTVCAKLSAAADRKNKKRRVSGG